MSEEFTCREATGVEREVIKTDIKDYCPLRLCRSFIAPIKTRGSTRFIPSF